MPVADPATGSDVPELLDKAHRAANAVDAGVRAALDPIKELIKTPPRRTPTTSCTVRPMSATATTSSR